MKIINLTQHEPSVEQVENGVVQFADLSVWESIKKASTFNDLPSKGDLEVAASFIASTAASRGFERAMIGGAPFFMGFLERALVKVGVQPLYAFSVRESVEETQLDGSVKKINVFRHKGFVEI